MTTAQTPPPTASGPLAGTLVVQLADGVASEHCGRLLGDFGADVVRVAHPSRSADWLRRQGPFARGSKTTDDGSLFQSLACNKFGVALNLEVEPGRRLLRRLLVKADVFVHGMKPGASRAAGLDHETLRGINERLVNVAITGFGQTGPYSEYSASDLICCAAGNISYGIGSSSGRPLMLPLSLASYQAGAMGFNAVLAALLQRTHTEGSGAFVDVATVDVLTSLFSTAITAYPYRGVSGRRNGNHGGALYPDVFLPCKDGYIGLVCNQLQQWIRFLELMGNPEWTAEPRYRDRRKMTEDYPDDVDELLAPWLMAHTRDEIFRMCREKDIPVAPAYRVDELLRHPHLIDRAAFDTVRLDNGMKVQMPAVPYILSDIRPELWRRAPQHAEHTRQVLTHYADVGDPELESMSAAGVIA